MSGGYKCNEVTHFILYVTQRLYRYPPRAMVYCGTNSFGGSTAI